MEKMPRYVEIDYSKYEPDIPEDKLEAYYGLPQKVRFCKECVMSNQKPNSCYEFEHTIESKKKTMVIQDDGVCDACHACHNKANGRIDWALREKELRELCGRIPEIGRQLRLPGARLRRQGQLLRGPSAQIQIRDAPADRDLGPAYLHPLGLGRICRHGFTPGLITTSAPRTHDPPAADPPGDRKPVPPVPAVYPGAKAACAQDGRQVRHPACLLRRERGRVRQPDCRQQLRFAGRAFLRRHRLRPHLPRRGQPAPA